MLTKVLKNILPLPALVWPKMALYLKKKKKFPRHRVPPVCVRIVGQGAPWQGKSPGWVSRAPTVPGTITGWCPRGGRALPKYGLGTPSTARVLLASGRALP